MVKWCNENNCRLNEVSYEDMLTVIPEATKECVELFDPTASIKKRKVYGATGFDEVETQLKYWEEKLI